MQRKSLADATCPVARSLDVIGDWWSLLLVRDAFRGATRFGEFERSLGVARNILTTRLRKLVEEGIFEQQAASDGSAYNEYILTAKGRDLQPVIDSLWQWSCKHLYPAGQHPTSPEPFRHFLPKR